MHITPCFLASCTLMQLAPRQHGSPNCFRSQTLTVGVMAASHLDTAGWPSKIQSRDDKQLTGKRQGKEVINGQGCRFPASPLVMDYRSPFEYPRPSAVTSKLEKHKPELLIGCTPNTERMNLT